MDRRIIFLLVYLLTFVSTVLVGAVALYTGQGWVRSCVLALFTMWLMGISTQLLFQHLYQAVVRPIEHAKLDSEAEKAKLEINLDEIEAIDQAMQLEREVGKQAERAVKEDFRRAKHANLKV